MAFPKMNRGWLSMKFRITCCYLASDQTIDRFDTMMQSLYIYIYLHTCFLYANMCLLFVSVQALAESAVGNGGRGAHEGGGASRSDCCDFKCHWLAWLDLPRESPKILMILVFWVTNILWILVLCEQIVDSPLFLPGIDAKVCLFACKIYSCVRIDLNV